jgi:hypothetical protein
MKLSFGKTGTLQYVLRTALQTLPITELATLCALVSSHRCALIALDSDGGLFYQSALQASDGSSEGALRG